MDKFVKGENEIWKMPAKERIQTRIELLQSRVPFCLHHHAGRQEKAGSEYEINGASSLCTLIQKT